MAHLAFLRPDICTAIAVAVIVTGCACGPSDTAGTQKAAAAPAAAVDYVCGGRDRLNVKWTAEAAQVTASGGTWLLPRARSGSGARYADSRREVWEHQDELRWTDAGAGPVTCYRQSRG